MNRRQKLLILILVSAVLCLSAAIISLRLADAADSRTDSEMTPAEPAGTVELFPGSNGRWGARTANGRVLIEPKWYYLKTMSDTVLIARDSDGKEDRFGLIGINGELLVPCLYQTITMADPKEPDLWVASFTENGQPHFHLYHADGTRWSDSAWDACTYENGVLSVTRGRDRYEGILRDGRICWRDWYSEYPVGLHKLVMQFDESAMRQLPPADTLSDIGETAASFLRYLFVTKIPPDASLISSERTAAIRVDYRYLNCRLISAEVSRIKIRQTDGLPSYLVQMHVVYQRQEDDTGMERIETSLDLVLTRNAAGSYTYSSFSDAQMNAASGGFIS